MQREHSANIFVLALFSALISAVSLQKEENYLICKPVQSLFSSSEHRRNSTNQQGPQGPSGKRGPRGFVGAPGPVGPEGSMPDIDWNAIDRRIKFQLDARLSCSGVVYGRYCYKLIIKSMKESAGGGKSWAETECAYRGGGSLVDIESEEMHDLLYTYIQDAWVGYDNQPRNYFYAWLGSVYRNGALRNSTGSEVYAKWRSGHPQGSSSDVMWLIGIRSGRGRDFGMETRSSSSTFAVPLCRFVIN